MSTKEFLGICAIILTIVSFYPYIRDIVRGLVKPHMFSWIIWATTTLVVFMATLLSGGGVGAWPIGLSGSITFGIAIYACLRKSDITITRSDVIFLCAALSSLPFWYFTSDPLWAVCILTGVDLLGFGPMIRKTWVDPSSESVSFFSMFFIRNGFAIAALEQYSLTTLLFPVSINCMLVLLMVIVIYRKPTLESA
jgi:hypothetical protein